MKISVFIKHSLFLLFLPFLIFSCSADHDQKDSSRPVPVRAAAIEQNNVVHNLQLVGNVFPSASVGITPRVTGEIKDIFFEEGQTVQQGDLLIRLDTRPYEAVLNEKKAVLEKSKALLHKAMQDKKRYGKLVTGGYVSREAFDETATNVATLQAEVTAAEAAVKNAALNLEYCTILAPISGRIGKLNVHKGNMVFQNTNDPIANIDTIAPSYVLFSLPEIHLPVIMENFSKKTIPIQAQSGGGKIAEGKLMLMDNSIDKNSGTIQLRGIFPNQNSELWPGQFVTVNLPLGEMDNALIIPSSALQPGRNETQLYVIDENNKVVSVPVTPLFEAGSKTIIKGNVTPGQKVITEGHMRIAPGMTVQEITE